MLQKFQQHIKDRFPFLIGRKLLIAISGGIDSVVLTHLFYQLNFDVSLAHCNFKLRGNESDIDEEFVKNLGNQLDLKTFTKQFDTEKHSLERKLSTQIVARELRYDWFKELLEKHQFDYVLTAHHADDNIETFLINLTRGTGLDGLTGIPEKNNKIVRPMLIFSQDEIVQYANKNNIEWREDATNAETKYLRNKIRHKIVPTLKEINPNLSTGFSKTLEHLRESQQIIDDRIKQVSEKIIFQDLEVTKFNISKIKQLSNPKAYLYQFFKNYGFTDWDSIYNLLSAQSGKFLKTKTHRLLKNRDFLLFSRAGSLDKKMFFIDENTSNITKPVLLNVKKATKNVIEDKNSILVDKNLLIFPLVLRRWNNGDYFYPIGMNGKKKVSKYFKDSKLSLIDKENTWLLCSNNNEIIWIVGMRQDRRFRVTSETKNIINLSI